MSPMLLACNKWEMTLVPFMHGISNKNHSQNYSMFFYATSFCVFIQGQTKIKGSIPFHLHKFIPGILSQLTLGFMLVGALNAFG